jgi:hypothetical protein
MGLLCFSEWLSNIRLPSLTTSCRWRSENRPPNIVVIGKRRDDGAIETLMGATPIPRMVLIDAQGKIVYDSVGYNEEDLRTEIAKLGPQYAPLAKAEESPCIASK